MRGYRENHPWDKINRIGKPGIICEIKKFFCYGCEQWQEFSDCLNNKYSYKPIEDESRHILIDGVLYISQDESVWNLNRVFFYKDNEAPVMF